MSTLSSPDLAWVLAWHTPETAPDRELVEWSILVHGFGVRTELTPTPMYWPLERLHTTAWWVAREVAAVKEQLRIDWNRTMYGTGEEPFEGLASIIEQDVRSP